MSQATYGQERPTSFDRTSHNKGPATGKRVSTHISGRWVFRLPLISFAGLVGEAGEDALRMNTLFGQSN
jgi:hypothetical protein